MVDWSGGNDTGPTPRKDAIWIGEAGQSPRYLRNRLLAEEDLAEQIETSLTKGERMLIGFDFPFGYPAGFARALTGQADPMAVWDWLTARIEDAPAANNRFDVAGAINRGFGGASGPFWGNPLKREIDGLARTKAGYANPFADKRACETRARGSFTCWQLAGAGAVGSQVLMGLPVLNRLRQRFAGQVAIWPFDPLTAPVAFVEIWPGLINAAVRAATGNGQIRDAVQVDMMARVLAGLAPDRLAAMLAVNAPEEGWIFGLGLEQELTAPVSLKPPPLRNDCFALPPGVDWTPVDQALGMLQDRLTPVVGIEEVPLMQAAGRVLAGDLVALRSNPPQANTAVDGYGFAAASLPEGDVVLPLVQGRSAAGVPFQGAVPAGHAVRVLTGAALPKGVDTVVLDEDCAVDGGHVAFRGGVKPGANTRRAGEDVTKGAVALQVGQLMTPADLALAAAVGLGRVPVFERLRVGVLSTGDEVVEPGAEAGPGQIFDANRAMLLTMIARFGFEPVDLGRVPDDRSALRARLDEASQRVHLVLTSGGASAGDEDHVSALLREAGAMQEWRIALKPGRPLALGLWEGVPVFGLPGNPVAAFVCTLIFARPAMGLLAGAGWSVPQGFDMPAGFSKSKKLGRREYLRARIRDGRVEVFKSEGSGRVSGLSWAEGLVELPDGAALIQPGDRVRYIPFGSFGL
ncbi:molybdenum cofactor synthesis domain-containing protein [Tropicibacter oceani]|uniref:Molybdopterin molybdenumtransferase n=1 Tax=Tropicibacter oceani TaxID=3058420 RepID=A0ABY8QMB7_9RHOB|nr:gephyrin-like molybdotransferase Glp [Tropicibacter oceani]WGW05780.1 molybdopterin-binding protein [Tropicibacter oceani]